MKKFKQAERTERDGAVWWKRLEDGTIQLKIGHDANVQIVEMTEYNAARILGILAFTLGIKLPAAVEKEIKL